MGAGVGGVTGAGVVVTGAIVGAVTGAGATPFTHCLWYELELPLQTNPGSQQPIVYIVKVKEDHIIRINFET
jgi:hypothetical protein